MWVKKKRTKKRSKQKSFYFEDHLDTQDFVNVKNNKQAKTSLNRTVFLFFIFLSLTAIFSFKIFYITLFNDNVSLSDNNYKKLIKTRADIVDRNNVILARNADSYSAAIRSKLVKDKKKLLIQLRLLFPDLDFKTIAKKIDNSNYVYIKKRLTTEEYDSLWLLGNKAIEFEKNQLRFYPHKNHFSHILGQIDQDNNGISGIEKYFDHQLKDKTLVNSSLKLTLDVNLQYLIRNELIKAKNHFKTIGSAALLMNVNNGEILSLISLPDYNLNHRSSINNQLYTNKITKGVYEMGSVFKIFTLAAGIENKVIDSNTMFNNLESKIFCAGRSISEHDKLPTNLSAEDILIRSSNIGAIRIAQKLGQNQFKDFLNLLRLFETIDFELEEIGTPLVFKWGKCKLATASFGHGVTTTPLQLARAYAILGNGGYEISPTILAKKNSFQTERKKIVSLKTSKSINDMLRKVVALEKGTANFANIEGYDVGGKTGTALKIIDGVYSDKKFNTFVSLFPSRRPKYVLLVILDEPKSAPNFTYVINGIKKKGQARNESGWNSVYVAGKIIEKIGPILAINNPEDFKKF